MYGADYKYINTSSIFLFKNPHPQFSNFAIFYIKTPVFVINILVLDIPTVSYIGNLHHLQKKHYIPTYLGSYPLDHLYSKSKIKRSTDW